MMNYYPQPQKIPMGYNQTQVPVLKGHPVSSLDEVRAMSVDFDGSISYFPSLANDKIYTKQINMDGTSTVKMYERVEIPTEQPAAQSTDLVTKEEFNKTVQTLLEEINALKPKEEGKNSVLTNYSF